MDPGPVRPRQCRQDGRRRFRVDPGALPWGVRRTSHAVGRRGGHHQRGMRTLGGPYRVRHSSEEGRRRYRGILSTSDKVNSCPTFSGPGTPRLRRLHSSTGTPSTFRLPQLHSSTSTVSTFRLRQPHRGTRAHTHSTPDTVHNSPSLCR